MAENYRVRVKRGDQEIEVESSDKAYVDAKLKALLDQENATLLSSHPSDTPRKGKDTGRPKKTAPKKNTSDETAPSLDIAALVGHIKEAPDYSKLEERILNKRDQLARIMMCMHYAAEVCDDPHVTTGQVEAITDQFGVKVTMANAANNIKKNQRFFTGKTIRKKGQPVPYKLNRQGETAFRALLQGTKS